MHMHKRGLSPVIATVLLLIITFVAVAILATYIIPFITGSLKDSGSCYKVLNGLTFSETGYNCVANDVDAAKERTGFSVRVDNENIVGFKVNLYSQGQSEVREIMNGTQANSIVMLNGGALLEMPQTGGVLTYVATDNMYERIELNPILRSGMVCGVSDTLHDISPCLDETKKQQLLASS